MALAAEMLAIPGAVGGRFEVCLDQEDFKFNAAHFVAFKVSPEFGLLQANFVASSRMHTLSIMIFPSSRQLLGKYYFRFGSLHGGLLACWTEGRSLHHPERSRTARRTQHLPVADLSCSAGICC